MDPKDRIFMIFEKKWGEVLELYGGPDRQVWGGYVSREMAVIAWAGMLKTLGVAVSREKSETPDPSTLGEWDPLYLHIPEDVSLKILALGSIHVVSEGDL